MWFHVINSIVLFAFAAQAVVSQSILDNTTLDEKEPIRVQIHKACASILIFGNEDCVGEPLQKIVVPTNGEPNQECQPSSSFTSTTYYCDKKTNGFHQDIFLGSKDCGCSKPWWWLPKTKVFNTDLTQGECVKGARLEACMLSPCIFNDTDTEADEEHQVNPLGLLDFTFLLEDA